MLGLVRLRYNKYPTNLQYLSGSKTKSPLVSVNFKPCGNEKLAAFSCDKRTFEMIFNKYFVLLGNIFKVDLATSMPMKYLT